jgi:single-strand DNA-binding protein
MIGNLTRDPELKQLSTGQNVCRFGLASNRQFKNKQTGNLVQEVCFIDVDVWGAQAEPCKNFLQKGKLVLVEGRLKLDSWQDNEGNRRSKHSIVADRVTFLFTGVQDEATDENNTSEFSPAKSQQTQTGSIEEKSSSSSSSPTGEVSLKDNAPFDENLPF